MRRALRRARDGVALDATEAEILLGARGDDLDRPAAPRRRGCAIRAWPTAGRPGVVTYSRKVFIPLTRLCRDRCHYCTFATTPNRLPSRRSCRPTRCWRSPTQGAALGCKEALFTLGDRPEDRWPAAREWLDAHGYDSHAGLRAGDGDPGAGGDRPAAAPEPRRACRGRSCSGSSRWRRRWA